MPTIFEAITAADGARRAERQDARQGRLADLAVRKQDLAETQFAQQRMSEQDALKASTIGGFVGMLPQIPAPQRREALATFLESAEGRGIRFDADDLQGFNETLLPILDDDARLISYARGLGQDVGMPETPQLSNFRDVDLPTGGSERRAYDPATRSEVVVPGSQVGAAPKRPEGADIARFQSRFDAQTKEPRGVMRAYQKVAAAASDPTAAGDISLLIGYMKMLDPTSVVRETEFATAENAGGVPERIRNLFNKAREGTRLTEDQRADFLGQARKLYNLSLAEIEQVTESLTQQAARQNISPEDFVIPPGSGEIGADVDMTTKSDEELLGILFGGGR